MEEGKEKVERANPVRSCRLIEQEARGKRMMFKNEEEARGNAQMPTPEQVVTILPPFCFSMMAQTSLAHLNVPRRWTATTWSQSLSDMA